MDNNAVYGMLFIPVIIFLIMWLDSKFGSDSFEKDKSENKDKSWLNQEITVGRNPHVEYPTSPSRGKRWHILAVWFIPAVIVFLVSVIY